MSSPDHLIVPIAAQVPSDGDLADEGKSQPQCDKVLEYIVDQVRQHQCILFLGSAIHVPSPANSKYHYPKEKCPPIGSELSKHLADGCGFTGKDWDNLQRVSQYYETELKSRFRLVKEIENAVHKNRETSPVLHALANLDFPIVITTNYDNLYEKALEEKALNEEKLGQPVTKYDLSIYSPNDNLKLKTKDCSSAPDPRRPYILKMHGDISKPESIVITDE